MQKPTVPSERRKFHFIDSTVKSKMPSSRRLVPIGTSVLTSFIAILGIIVYLLSIHDFYRNFGNDGQRVALK
jgi:hypothetical protein